MGALDDLVRTKQVAGRPKDRVDVEILGALGEELRRDGRHRRDPP